MARWLLHDPVLDEDWTMPLNPDSAEQMPVGKSRLLSHALGFRTDQRVRTYVGKPNARNWGFGGVIRTKDHYDQLLYWSQKTNAITLTDHIGRVMTVYVMSFEPTDRKPTIRTPWRLRYSMKVLILEGPA